MDYDMTRLGDRQFEHLAQALLIKYVSPRVEIFGAGRDGGREATWKGPLPGAPHFEDWDGYVVAQAKYKYDSSDTMENLKWLKIQIKKELDEWAREGSARNPLPDYILFISNVRISAVPESGIDELYSYILELSGNLSLPLKGWDVWHYDRLRVLLDDAKEIRRTYAAWITPGDVLAALMDAQSQGAQNLGGVLRAHAAKVLVDDRRLNLTQAGSVGDDSVGLSDVFIDVPAYPPSRTEHETRLVSFKDLTRPVVPGIVAELIRMSDSGGRPSSTSGAECEVLSPTPVTHETRAKRAVLIGGPGQGKSTVGQFICQIYRAVFLEGSPVLGAPNVSVARQSVLQHAQEIGLNLPRARRWPVRVVLSDLADRLANGKCLSVLDYIAHQLTKRGGKDVSIAMAQEWLSSYPWLVIFDGLDEVPGASNREQVMQAVSDFHIDVLTSNGDVVAVATSRPQNYNGEFGRDECRHYELAALPRAIAISYGQRLIDVRLGAGSERAATSHSRFVRAVQDAATSRLLESPLQVTILTLLLERLGHAPRDRWRLFSQYYRVIYQREQEKGGELSELLQSHESDVHFIHYKIGLLLQQRAETAGETQGLLGRDEFKNIIAERLISQGSDEEEANQLAEKFVSLSTERLVFLATLREDQIGFEIRSLQEFMASEAILFGPDSRVISGLRAIAVSKYWRNVLLFAVGKIFAEKEHLRPQVVTLCAELNVQSITHEALLPGSRLAAAILAERVTLTQKNYSRVLAQSAVQCLNLPPMAVRELGLAQISAVPGAWEIYRSSVQEFCRIPDKRALRGIQTLAAAADMGDAAAVVDLKTALELIPADYRSELVREPWIYDFPTFLPLVRAELEGIGIAEGLKLVRSRPNGIDVEEILAVRGEALPPFLQVLFELSLVSDEEEPYSTHGEGADNLRFSLNPLSVELSDSAIDLVADADFDTGEALVLRAIVRLLDKPSAGNLAAALDVLEGLSSGIDAYANICPWPLAACISDVSTLPVAQRSKMFALLAELARSGELGDVDDWRSAETRWRSQGVSAEMLLMSHDISVRGEVVTLPIGPSVYRDGFPSGYGLGVTLSQSSALSLRSGSWVDSCLSLLEQRPSTSLRWKQLANHTTFVIASLMDYYPRDTPPAANGSTEVPAADHGSPFDLSRIFALYRRMSPASIQVPRRLVEQAVRDLDAYEDDLLWVGAVEHLSVRDRRYEPDTRGLALCMKLWMEDDRRWPLARLALQFSPFEYDRLTVEAWPEYRPQGAVSSLRLLVELIELVRWGTTEECEAWLQAHSTVFSRQSLSSVLGMHASRLVPWLTTTLPSGHEVDPILVLSHFALLARAHSTPDANSLDNALFRTLSSVPVGGKIPPID